MVKRVLYFICIIILLLMCYPVNAMDYEVGKLIAAGETATVKTDKFTYGDFIYQSVIDTSGNGKLSFSYIKNNMVTSSAVSINLLLFDGNMKNIGFLTYCSDKDLDSVYSGFKLSGGQSSPFEIMVSRKYFGDGSKSSADVKYVAVLDDNAYCEIGGYEKYLGKNVDEIVNEANNVVVKQKTDNNFILKYIHNSNITTYVAVIGLVLFGLVFMGVFLSSLYKKMYGKSTVLAYLPISNFYVVTKLAFGSIVALIFIIIYIIGMVLFYLKISVVFYLCSIFCGIAFIIDIIKLVTGRYDMLFFEPSMEVKGFEGSKGLALDSYNDSVDTIGDNNTVLDLNYNESNLREDNTDNFVKENGDFDISVGEGSSELNDVVDDSNDIGALLGTGNVSSSQFNDDDDSEESDLAKYFH